MSLWVIIAYLIFVENYIMPTIQLTAAQFKSDVFDYSTEKEWKFKGKLPAIIDFYADWCGPCKMVAPILEELSDDFKDQVVIYKVDTEAEEELSAVFQIRSIPSMLFIPTEKQPMMQAGALPKSELERIIKAELLASSDS